MNDQAVPGTIHEDTYKADFALFDRYVNFSSEILRISIAGIGAIGFIFGLSKEIGNTSALLAEPFFRWANGIGLILLAISSACALAHRYFATDGLHYHLKLCRGGAATNADKRNRLYDRSGRLLLISAIACTGGIVAVGASFLALTWIRA
jgi:hypothetical protein